MTTKLFHRDIHMPSAIRNLSKRAVAYRITTHARHAAASDRYGKLDIPASVTFSGADVVEAELTNGQVTKLVVRVSYDATRDAIFAIGFGGGAFLKTVWFNLKSDAHKTLDRSRYAVA